MKSLGTWDFEGPVIMGLQLLARSPSRRFVADLALPTAPAEEQV